MRVNRVFDLHKKRIARISDDRKYLTVNYEMDAPLGLEEKSVEYELDSEIGHISIKFEEKILLLDIDLKDPDLQKLYELVHVVAYLLGEGIELRYLHDGFPYYDIPRELNFGDYPFSFSNRKILIKDASKAIETVYSLLHNEQSIFSKLAYMLQVNTSQYPEIRFISEYSLLEYLSSSAAMRGVIFERGTPASQNLHKLSQEIEHSIKHVVATDLSGISQDKRVKNKIEEIFTMVEFKRLNTKGVEKDKIKSFVSEIDSHFNGHLGTPLAPVYLEYVDEWTNIRSRRGLAHGNVFKLVKDKERMQKDHRIMGELHNFLSGIFLKEFDMAYRGKTLPA